MNKKRFNLLLSGAKKKAWTTLFNATTTIINAGSHASVDDLSDNAFTLEGFFYPTSMGESLVGKFFHKGGAGFGNAGFSVYFANFKNIVARVFCATTPATATSANDVISYNTWYHVAITWDDAGDRKVRIYLNGSVLATSDAGVGAIVTDAANDLLIGNNSDTSRTFGGNIGWCRISNSIRYAANFTPPSRFVYPAVDANTIRLFKMNEGTGTAIVDYSANTQNAALSNGSWMKL